MSATEQAAPPPSDVDAALDGLVHQFSDPLAFLRELVQNAIDAGTSDVAISCTFAPGEGDAGVTTIEVADSGCGMTRAIIETQLTRLFASAKDGDHTKIGKFGIGFVSVFAIAPDVVVVDTSREGEHWRVIFARDRTYELRKLHEPLEGTRVRVIKANTRAEFEELRARVPATVRKWCRHTGCEIRVDGARINEPVDLPDAPCRVVVSDGVNTLVVGHPREARPFFGFYNAGLTLLEGDQHPEWLAGAPDEQATSAIAVKASSPQLEHTLTRDKVIEDDGYDRITGRVRGLVHSRLAELAVAMLAVALERPGPEPLLAYLCDAVRWHLQHGRVGLQRVWKMEVFRSPSGAGISMRTCAGRVRGRELLLARDRSRLTDALERDGRIVVRVRGEDDARLLRALVRPDVHVADVDARWCLAGPSDGRYDDDRGRALAASLRWLLVRCGAELSAVMLGRTGPPGSPAADLVAITQRDTGTPTPLVAARTVGTWWLARRRVLVVNETHPVVVSLVPLAATRPAFAAYLLAKSFWLGGRLDPRLDGELARVALELSR
ncbi:MAG TPA: ATP-binding protein [Nannocystaceae bacterium]|nr:ATP-binding protein [Nannocystaceae bacterium]